MFPNKSQSVNSVTKPRIKILQPNGRTLKTHTQRCPYGNISLPGNIFFIITKPFWWKRFYRTNVSLQRDSKSSYVLTTQIVGQSYVTTGGETWRVSYISYVTHGQGPQLKSHMIRIVAKHDTSLKVVKINISAFAITTQMEQLSQTIVILAVVIE